MSSFNLYYPQGVQVLVKTNEEVTSETVLAQGEVPSKIITLPAASIIKVKNEELLKFLIKKSGEEVKTGEVIASKKAGILGKGKKEATAPKDGKILSVREDKGEVDLGTLMYDYELISPGKGKVQKITDREITIDFLGEDLRLDLAFGTSSFGLIWEMEDIKGEADFTKIDFNLKDKILICRKWNLLTMIKANSVGVSGVLGVEYLFPLEKEKEQILRPYDLEGNAGFAIGRLSQNEYNEVIKHKGKNMIISPQSEKLCLLKP